MSANYPFLDSNGTIELLPTQPLGMDADQLLADFVHYHGHLLGRRTLRPNLPFAYQALAFATRDRLTERWTRTQVTREKTGQRRAFYLSLEYLLGRLLRNNLLSLDMESPATEALQHLSIGLEELCSQEPDAGLGNGGLGRLAACFLDSCATLALPVTGYGIRYQYGMFHQQIRNGWQVEGPDPWLREGFPWEIERSELSRTVKFCGRTVDHHGHAEGWSRAWTDTQDVLAVPYDVLIPGYRNEVVNTLRLWSAAATDAFDLEEFNAGSYADAVAAKNQAENISMVLYPNESNVNGKELRLRQQYFLASASLQDVLAEHVRLFGPSLQNFAEKNCFQLNDTHPAIAVAELMRLLLDEHRLDWDTAWELTRSTMAYTNHTLLPEALETWPVSLFEYLLPRLLDIIYEINAQFLGEVSRRWPGDNQRLARMSLIEEGPERRIRMAYLAIVGSFSVNGVAELHSRLLREGLFRDFAELWPQKFNNKTNGVTQRRWLRACNPALADLITGRIGSGWETDLDQLKGLLPLAEDLDFQAQWRSVRASNKVLLARQISLRTGVDLDTEMLFDVQVKRIHEYKRQLLNILHAIHLYRCALSGGDSRRIPRAIIIGGKAAPGYAMAKNIIKLINSVATVINASPATHGQLRVVFYPDYNVTAMEQICPATDLSEQISTAGKEASGTGNMKFMLNGALTIGTLDGANVEILDAVGADNFLQFGLTVEEVAALKPHYDPVALIDSDADLAGVMQLLESGHFNQFEPGIFDPIIQLVRNPQDPWMIAADFRSYLDAQGRAERLFADPVAWTAASIRNTAASGRFSTDRTIADYNRDIWKLEATSPSSA